MRRIFFLLSVGLLAGFLGLALPTSTAQAQEPDARVAALYLKIALQDGDGETQNYRIKIDPQAAAQHLKSKGFKTVSSLQSAEKDKLEKALVTMPVEQGGIKKELQTVHKLLPGLIASRIAQNAMNLLGSKDVERDSFAKLVGISPTYESIPNKP